MCALQKDYSAAVQMYEGGLSVGSVAKAFGITRQAMWQILVRRGVTMRPQLRWGTENHFFRGTRAADASQNKLEKALARGDVTRPSACEMCGATPRATRAGASGIQAHHPDYNRPLDVMWLCKPCHHNWHKTNRAIPLERR